MENYFEVNVRDYTKRRDMTAQELDKHKKRLKTKHNKKTYLKTKCNNKIYYMITTNLLFHHHIFSHNHLLLIIR